MTRTIARATAAVLLGFLIAGPAPAADAKSDKGKKQLVKLFDSAANPAAEATVRVQVDSKDAVLGTIVGKDGFILTKGSELLGKESKVKTPLSCILRDGSAFDASVVGYHKDSDLMLLKVNADDLTPVTFAASKLAEPGNFVATTSAGSEPIAVGVISSVSRKLYGEEATIQNGNRGYLGILFDQRADFKATIVGEIKNKKAEKAGLKKGDLIVAVNDKAIKVREDLFGIMNETRPGEIITVKVKRKGKDEESEEVEIKFPLIPLAEMDKGALQNTFAGELSDRRGGFPMVIQHETILTPKQVGGPIVDLDGHVLGLNIARAGRVESWALPGEVVKKVFDELKDGKHPLTKTVAKTDEKKEEKKEEKKDDK